MDPKFNQILTFKSKIKLNLENHDNPSTHCGQIQPETLEGMMPWEKLCGKKL